MSEANEHDAVVKKPSPEHCRALWEGNKRYVEEMGDKLHIDEARALVFKQDALYLAWFDGDFSALGV